MMTTSDPSHFSYRNLLMEKIQQTSLMNQLTIYVSYHVLYYTNRGTVQYRWLLCKLLFQKELEILA